MFFLFFLGLFSGLVKFYIYNMLNKLVEEEVNIETIDLDICLAIQKARNSKNLTQVKLAQMLN